VAFQECADQCECDQRGDQQEQLFHRFFPLFWASVRAVFALGPRMTRGISIDTSVSRVRKLQAAILTRSRLISHSLPRGRFKSAMLTLTYREDDQWHAKHIATLLQRVRDHLSRRGLKAPYVWVAELTQRGRIHYHVLFWLPKGFTLPKPDKQGWWPWGSTRIEWARNAVGYLAKYASKGTEPMLLRQFPKGCRLHGAGGFSDAVRLSARWWSLPAYLRAACFPSCNFMRRVGGGFVSRVTGAILSPVFGLMAVGHKSVRVQQIAPFPLAREPRPLSDPVWLCALLGLKPQHLKEFHPC
jgi:hypothetical protein